MQCPYLSTNRGNKTCHRMLDLGMDGEVTDFDIEHFCEGNPVCCYFFRVSLDSSEPQKNEAPKAKIGRLVRNVSRDFEVELHP